MLICSVCVVTVCDGLALNGIVCVIYDCVWACMNKVSAYSCVCVAMMRNYI